MSRTHLVISAAACAVVAVPASAQSWIIFTNQTSTRLVADPSVGTADVEEKDFAWGDFDHDGDIDLVNVRKQPFSTPGRKRNVLFMNEGIAEGHPINGVLVDRTLEYATAATDGGQGMLDLTADRDVEVTDVNNDGWLDIVTATTYGQGLTKTISHPRIYINLGAPNGTWLGFLYDEPRIPTLAPGAPNFCGVGAGDITGDKAPDLYFVGYSGYPDRLLINDGNGNFSDQTTSRLTSAMYTSSFGTTAHIADMNGDGKADIVKSENGPVKTHYNNGGGFFTNMQATYSGSAYNTSVGDLNGDGKLDIIVSDDGSDRYLLNNGNGGNGQATFTNLSFPNSVGFNGNSRFADLNNDGKMDAIVCDVDVDAPGCERISRIYRNLGNTPNVTMVDQGFGGIPQTTMTGVHDIAIFDIDGDGRKDLVIAKCGSLSIWMNQPLSGLLFDYPQGLPSFIPANQTFEFQVQVTGVGGATPAPGSGMLYYSINNNPYVSVPMTVISGDLYSASFPVKQCTDVVRFYVSAQKQGGGSVTDPANAPIGTYSAIAAFGMQTAMQQTFEADTSGWTVTNNASLTSGAWEVADPNGTINGGVFAAPEDDAGNGLDVKAFVTQNGPAGGPAVSSDVDGGPTILTSPLIDLAGSDATIYYDRWFYCEDAGGPDADFLTIQVTKDDGVNWVTVESIGTTNNAWETASFRVGQYVLPSSLVRVRFQTSDSPNNSVTEAGIDNFRVEKLVCAQPCIADINGDSTVNSGDLLAVINAWGPCPGCPTDLNGDNNVNSADLLIIINAWGPCQ